MPDATENGVPETFTLTRHCIKEDYLPGLYRYSEKAIKKTGHWERPQFLDTEPMPASRSSS